jgi:hypothetical protein
VSQDDDTVVVGFQLLTRAVAEGSQGNLSSFDPPTKFYTAEVFAAGRNEAQPSGRAVVPIDVLTLTSLIVPRLGTRYRTIATENE